MARQVNEINAEVRNLGLQMAQARMNFLRTEADLLERLKACEAELAEAQATEARKTPEALVGSSRVDLQACKLEYSIVSPK